MSDMLLGISQEYLYFRGKTPQLVSDVHNPYFLAFPSGNAKAETVRKNLIERWEKNKIDHEKLSKIKEIGEIETYRSFCDFNTSRKVFKVYTKESYVVPDISSYLFFEHNLFTAEHDIPYKQRALTDLAAEDKVWLFDTHGDKKTVKVFVYDIETTQFAEGKKDIPIDIIGYSNFDISFESEKNLDNEQFSFEIIDLPSHWEDIDVKQLISRNTTDEIENLHAFCKMAEQYDIISGHNIASFDNFQIYERIKGILEHKSAQLSVEEIKDLKHFIYKYCRPDKSYHFGTSSEVVQFYPSSFDTYLGARKFYSFLNEFSLKALAPFLGVIIKDRIILAPSQIKIDERTLKYNKHDVQEQIGVTLNLIQQALPLAFTTCMPFDMLLPAGAVNMWDHMAMIRGARQKKIMPPICRVKSIAQTLLHNFKGCSTKEEIVSQAKKIPEQLSKDLVRVIKYGEEMPEWVEYPNVIHNENAKDADESLNYHMPGGMTIKPDSEANSHFIPWYHVVVADVGAMYPTILKAMNVGADTIKLAKKNETPDEWIWLKKLPKEFLQTKNIHWREVTASDSFADKGYMLGIKIDPKQGVVNGAMTGIMSMIAKIKNELKKAKEKGNPQDLQMLKMMYQSMKGARNAGSVDHPQRIILQNPSGNTANMKIGEFVDNAIKKYGHRIEKINGTEFEIADVKENWTAVSVNKDGKTEIKRVKKAVRHKWNKKLVKITTKSGYTIVTPNHSVFTMKKGKIEEISAGDINYDTLLVHAEKIPSVEKNQIIKSEGKTLGDCFAIPPKKIEFVDPSSDYVYDISVEDNENFLDSNGGILLHNTHGILSAPTVTGRQFNLWGAATITTKGQKILADTLTDLENQGIRIVYGDTDGIYLGCSRSAANIPDFSKSLELKTEGNEGTWLTKPDKALSAINECNKKWQNELNYPDFELEPEEHDAMIFVKHKNYLIFDSKNGKIVMNTKGNNFKGSDKANIARKALGDIMMNVLKENLVWEDEDAARKKVKESIQNNTKEIISKIDLTKVDLDDLTLIQSVQPAKRYKTNQDGSISTFGKRSLALEKLLGRPINNRVKLRFVVTKKPLPGISKPSKSGVKPIDYMYPVELLKDMSEIDLDWYKKMIENYIQGAFGLSDMQTTEQTGLDAWM